MGDFSQPKIIRLMESLTEGFNKGEANINDYAEMLHEWTRMFKHLGKALSIAFKGKYFQ